MTPIGRENICAWGVFISAVVSLITALNNTHWSIPLTAAIVAILFLFGGAAINDL